MRGRAGLRFTEGVCSRCRMIFLFLTLLLFAVFLQGCSINPIENNSSHLRWPEPPAKARVSYQGFIRSSADLELERPNEWMEMLTGISASDKTARVFAKPYDVAAKKGYVILSDTRKKTVHVFDFFRKKIFPIGWRNEGRLVFPLGVAIDDQLQFFVADSASQQVVVYDKQGHFLRVIGDGAEFSHLIDVAVQPKTNKVFLLDRGGIDSTAHRIAIFSKEGVFERYLGERGHRKGLFNHPNQLAFSRKGDLYVLDAGNFRVQVFSPDLQLLRVWGQQGDRYGDLARPRGLAVSDNDIILISDAAFQKLLLFDAQGQLLLNVGNPGANKVGLFALPGGVAIDEKNNIFFVDQVLGRVDVLKLLTDASD